ncbi:hypothetical protein H4R18_001671 [Coemansia javaensis]|uniref:Uncharacterized protein n=1 Tax=Coemansia javaensis TaxID=2761396 RepID=A0A9W8HD02_9FUNG|nr:hypothetical protein H4R18_001671 [Coemansia javaensis]
MGRRPLVILDDFFVKDDVVSAIARGGQLGVGGDCLEMPSENPFVKRLLSSTHVALRHWVRSDDVRVTYSGWLYNAHLAIIAAVAARYAAGLAGAPLAHSLGTLASICLAVVLGFHVLFFVSLNFRPAWFGHAVFFHSPFAWAAAWLLVFVGDGDGVSGVAVAGRGPVRSALDRRVGPAALLLMHVFVWYTRRTVIGIAVFERKICASAYLYWTHRLYSVAAALVIVLVWKAYPYAPACWYLYRGAGLAESGARGLLRDWTDERGMVGLLRLGAAMLVSGGTHAMWYSFISYAYHMVVWRERLRDGLAVWVVGDRAMCTRLV